MEEVLDFVKYYKQSDSLLIVYYGGHGAINSGRQASWMCNAQPESPSVNWSAIQTLFENCTCDVLFLLDCCAAAGATPESGQRTIETIAACGFETWAPGPGRHSFTNALIEVLEYWKDVGSFSAAMLHSEILSVIKYDRPERRAGARTVEHRKTPIYILSTKDPRSRSIQLSSRLRLASRVRNSASTASTTLTPNSAVPRAPPRTDIFDTSQLHSRVPTDEFTVPHVLLSVALEGNLSLDPESWARWIRDLPALAKYVVVEGVFRSHSTMVLVSLPVPIWNVLHDDLAVTFIGYVETRNALVTASEEANIRTKELVSPLAAAKSQKAYPRIRESAAH
ncbi:hypothetical protein L207DRAFT_50525 [Hyaloscypha variabilis F]|uniref:Uncharacterized protein n=1 Tax=Hyaloscypha variabilis (strain UAMH 11265 / GT02V1 / F) TaxID=1149755 RepID=A0A2J6RKM5_HYAVF|nr:hypothetical protein L207DRAFT_50525 [Hyaloscypha variabilis F]